MLLSPSLLLFFSFSLSFSLFLRRHKMAGNTFSSLTERVEKGERERKREKRTHREKSKTRTPKKRNPRDHIRITFNRVLLRSVVFRFSFCTFFGRSRSAASSFHSAAPLERNRTRNRIEFHRGTAVDRAAATSNHRTLNLGCAPKASMLLQWQNTRNRKIKRESLFG